MLVFRCGKLLEHCVGLDPSLDDVLLALNRGVLGLELLVHDRLADVKVLFGNILLALLEPDVLVELPVDGADDHCLLLGAVIHCVLPGGLPGDVFLALLISPCQAICLVTMKKNC